MQEKNYGIDALRMLAMFMIVILHILNQGGLLKETVRFTSQYEIGWMIESAVYCAVDICALISGYVWVNTKYKFRNIIELWLQVVFYTASITFLFWMFLPSSVSIIEWIKAFFPVMFNQYWYFSSYVALFLFIPLLNIIIDKMERRKLLFCIGMILFFFGGIQTLFYSDVFGTNDGYSAIWIMIMYMVGGYIRKYGLCTKGKTNRFLVGYFVMVGIAWLSKLTIEIMTLHILGEVRAGNYFISYKSPMIFLSAIFLFLYFERITIPSFGKKIIRFFAPMSFSVYLIHGHPLVFSYLMKDAFVEYAHFPLVMEILAIFATSLSINLICYAIDFIRLKLFRWLRIREKIDSFEKKIIAKYTKA